jgi:hypothetical protein
LRHFRSILYALVLAPAAWILIGVGSTRDLTVRGRDDLAVESATGLLLLLLAGAAYGILLFAPISPAGPSLAGLVFLGIAGWALAAPTAYAGAWPHQVAKEGFDLSRPGYGLAALLAVPLICTALSARRWEKYEPPVLPIIGQLGRARGAAAAGTPIAVLETAVLDISGAAAGRENASDDTTVLRNGPAGEQATTALDGEVTTVLGESGGAVAAGEPAAEASSVDDEPGEDFTARDEPTALVAEESTVVDSSGEADADPPAPDEPDADGESTESTRSLTAPDAQLTRVNPLPRTPPAASDEPPAEITHSLTASDTETTRALGGSERATRDLSEADQDTTRALRAPDPEHTRDLSGRRADQEQTQAIPYPRMGAVGGDQTQVIRMPGPRGDQERTQVIRAGLVEPPGERTQVIKVTSAGPTVTPAEEERPPSVADAERPHFADDPTSRIVPPGANTGDHADGSQRAMTVTSMERPPDEIAGDTTRVDIPVQRRPTSER